MLLEQGLVKISRTPEEELLGALGLVGLDQMGFQVVHRLDKQASAAVFLATYSIKAVFLKALELMTRQINGIQKEKRITNRSSGQKQLHSAF